jgi:hypothetical protein
MYTNLCDDYTFSLSKNYREKAFDELGENEEIRNEALKKIREWIREHPNIQECRMGKIFR